MSEEEQHRRQHFAAKLTDPRYPSTVSEKTLRVTYNGKSWCSIGLTPEEARKVIELLTPYAAK